MSQLSLPLDVAPAKTWVDEAIALYHEGWSYSQLAKKFGRSKCNVHHHLSKAGCKGLRKRQSGLMQVLNESIEAAHPRHRDELKRWFASNHEALRELDLRGDRVLLTEQRIRTLSHRELHRNSDARDLVDLQEWQDKIEEFKLAPPPNPYDYEAVKRRREAKRLRNDRHH